MKLDKYLECFEKLDDSLIDDAAPAFKERKHISKKIILSAALVVVIAVMTLLTAYKLGDNHTSPEIPLQPTATESSEELYVQSVTGSEAELSTENVMSPLEDRGDYTSETVSDSVAEDVVDGLPQLTPILPTEGNGFEGILVYDISEFDKNDPFDPKKKLDTLPVFKNLAYNKKSAAYGNFYLTETQMKEIAEDQADYFGIKIISHKTNWTGLSGKDEYIYRYDLICDRMTINVYPLGGIRYEFNEEYMLKLPNELALNSNATREDKKKVVDYIVSTYNEYFPCEALEGSDTVDYTFSGEYVHSQKWLHNYYENIVYDYEQSILNFSFGEYSFELSDDLKYVVSITVPGDYTAYTEKLGDYPVIGYEKALDCLINGKYLSTVYPNELWFDGIIERDEVHMTEIVYINSAGNKTFMPFYKFYVLLEFTHEKSPEGLKNYGVFYVPAVNEEYLNIDYVVINGQWGMSNENT